MKANAVNLASFANALCHFNATPLSVAVLAPYAWSKNLACGGAWQSVLLGRNGAWQGVVKLATHNTANSAWQMFAGEAGKAKMGQCLGGGLLSLSLSLSLVVRTFWHTFAFKLKGFFTHFVVVFSHLIVNFSYFIAVLTHLFAYKRHFLGHCAFLKFSNALFFGLFALVIVRRFRKDGVAIHNFSVAFALWIATLALLARNDGQRKRTLPFENGGGFCHFEPFAKRRPNGFQA